VVWAALIGFFVALSLSCFGRDSMLPSATAKTNRWDILVIVLENNQNKPT
jgi:hypothetical protein